MEEKRTYSVLKSRDEMSKEEFDEVMRIGLEQAKTGDSLPINEAFARLKSVKENASRNTG